MGWMPIHPGRVGLIMGLFGKHLPAFRAERLFPFPVLCFGFPNMPLGWDGFDGDGSVFIWIELLD